MSAFGGKADIPSRRCAAASTVDFLFCLKTVEVLSLSRHGVLILGWRVSHGGWVLGGAGEKNIREPVRAMCCGSDRARMV
jgi:hypothetical protein